MKLGKSGFCGFLGWEWGFFDFFLGNWGDFFGSAGILRVFVHVFGG